MELENLFLFHKRKVMLWKRFQLMLLSKHLRWPNQTRHQVWLNQSKH